MKVSVILSTYNSSAWLEKVIWGYATQCYRNFELLIADDGSTQKTALVIRRLQSETQLELRHIWHEDKGFRKSVILNEAICAAEGEYLVFSDGDCIPRWDFVDQHVRLAEQGYLLSGGVVRLPRGLSERITRQDVFSGRATSAPWLTRHGLLLSRKLLLLTPRPHRAVWFDYMTTTTPTWNGHNSSGWKTDILIANGYDERMQYGGLDRELGERLMNAGIRAKQVRHRAVCVHLDHQRNYVYTESIRRNRRIRKETRRNRLAWTPHGIFKDRELLRAAGDEADRLNGAEPLRRAA